MRCPGDSRPWHPPEERSGREQRDLLPGGVETVIGADSTLAATVDRIMLDTGLSTLPAREC